MNVRQINVLIVDDEPMALAQARQKVSIFVNDEKIHTSGNSVEMMRILKSSPIDLAFLDMEMPDTDGFSIVDYIRRTQPKTKYVFLTGHTELGAKSYDYEPLDFLCKPVEILRMEKTFQRFDRSRSENRYAADQIALESTAGFVLISPSDILYITRENRKNVIYCRQLSHVMKNSLEELEMIFGEFDLFRCHQSFLVSLPHVTSVVQADFGKTYWAILDNDAKVPVSRNRYHALREVIAQRGTQFL